MIESDNLHEVTPLLSQLLIAVLSKEDEVVAVKATYGFLAVRMMA